MDMFDFAGLLFGGNRNRPEATTVTATGAASSEDGVASITLDADVTPAEDVGEDADQTVIDLPTSPDVDEGDELIVTLVGDGPLKTPIVTANPGAGDRMRALANSAKTIANAAQEVAQAINQHFFADTSGIHVTEATQEDWDVNHSGANVLINSIGQLFRDGLNNLLTLTTEGGARALTIWDGLGNSASNILARFSSDGISFADGTSFDIGDSSSYIHFDGNGHINIGGSGLTIGGYIPTGGVNVNDLTAAAQSATLNSNISVGGRNLLQDSKFTTAFNAGWWTLDGLSATLSNNKLVIDGSVAATGNKRVYQSTGRFKHVKNITYTFSCDIVATAACQVSFGRRYGTVNEYGVTFNATTTSQRLSGTYTATGGGAFCISGVSNSATVTISNPKLEIGNTPTDWSPAPEDVDSAISDAAKTATSYVTKITGQNGIMVHPSTDDDTGVRITSDVDIMRGGNSVLNVGTQGDTTSTDAGVTIYDGTASKNVVASFDSDEVSLGVNSSSSTIDMCGGVFTFEVDNSTPSRPMASVRVNASSGSGVTTIPTLRLTAGTGTDQYGFDIAGIGSAQYPISVVAGGGNVVNMGGLGLQTYAIDLAGIGGGGTFNAYDGIYMVTQTGTNFWSTVPGTVLWSSSGHMMTSSHTASLAYNVSTCHSGIVLHFQPYTSGTTQNYFHQYCFVPKTTVTASAGAVHNFTLCNSGFAKVGMKALRIYDDRIVGDDTNDDTGTASGITFDNKYWVMTQVIAV